MKIKYILYFFLLFVQISWTQQKANDATITIVNSHATYINYTINNVTAIREGLIEFNRSLNLHIEHSDRLYPELRFDEIAPEYRSYRWKKIRKTRQDLENITSELYQLEDKLSQRDKEAFGTFFKRYQTQLEKVLKNYDAIKAFSKTLPKKPSKTEIYDTYQLLEAFKIDYDQLLVINSDFPLVIQKIWGKQTLPSALQYSKDVIINAKNIIRAMRSKDIATLQKLKVEHARLMKHKLTGDELRILEKFGDFGYTDNGQTQERANIFRTARDYGRVVEAYTSGNESPYKFGQVKTIYSRQYYFDEQLTDTFNHFGLKMAKQYNDVLQRANRPVFLVVQEFPPFGVSYAEGFKKQPISVSSEGVSPLTPETPEVPIVVQPSQPNISNQENINTLEGALTNNLVLLLDVSASMRRNDNLVKLKKSINHLIDILRPEDQLTVLTYSGKVTKVLETSSNYDKEALKEIVNGLQSDGKTNANLALDTGYKISKANFIKKGNNRIIIASDGDFTVSRALKKYIEVNGGKGIHLSTLHYELPGAKIKSSLKNLSEKGRGTYSKISNESEAISALVQESKQH